MKIVMSVLAGACYSAAYVSSRSQCPLWLFTSALLVFFMRTIY